MSVKKQKVDSERRAFKSEWTSKYFFTEVGSSAVCIICQKSIAVLKVYNIRRILLSTTLTILKATQYNNEKLLQEASSKFQDSTK